MLFVARLNASERYKGIDHLFQALERLKQTHPDIHLNLVGTGDDQARIKEEARMVGVEHMVTFWGSLSAEKLAAAYQDCDVFVMPSKNEGFGIVFLEAMVYAKPCIGCNHGGTPEAIEHGKSGFLVEYGDVEALASHIATLDQDRALRLALGARGQELVQTRFSAARFRETYHHLILDGTPGKNVSHL